MKEKEEELLESMTVFWSPIFFGTYGDLKQLRHDIKSILNRNIKLIYQKYWKDKPEIYKKKSYHSI